MVMNDIRPIEPAQQSERQPRTDEMFCASCGAIIKREAAICVACGVATRRTSSYSGGVAGRGESKSKTAAIILAIFFGYWTWLYTYREDSGKFWITVAVNVVCFVLTIFTLGIFALVWIPIMIGMYIWAIIDTVGKSDDWYFNY